MKHYRLIKILSNVLFGIGAAMGALALYLTISSRISLPPGTCPIDNQRPLIFASIGVLLISLILSFVADKHKKRLSANADKQDKAKDERGDNG